MNNTKHIATSCPNRSTRPRSARSLSSRHVDVRLSAPSASPWSCPWLWRWNGGLQRGWGRIESFKGLNWTLRLTFIASFDGQNNCFWSYSFCFVGIVVYKSELVLRPNGRLDDTFHDLVCPTNLVSLLTDPDTSATHDRKCRSSTWTPPASASLERGGRL